MAYRVSQVDTSQDIGAFEDLAPVFKSMADLVSVLAEKQKLDPSDYEIDIEDLNSDLKRASEIISEILLEYYARD